MSKQGLTLKALIALETKQFQQGLNKIKRQLNGFGNFLKSAFAVGSITAFGKQVVQVSKDFEDSIARVKAITNATQDEFNNMRKAALKMGETTRYTASEAANALENLTRNGMSASQATKALSGVMQLAQANAISLAEAADIVTNTLNMFGLSVENTTRVNDVLSSTAGNAATNITELYEALVNAAPAAKTLGFNIEEVSAAIGALAQKGVKGSDAGTQLRMSLTKMADPKIIKKMQEMGVAIDEQSMKEEGLLKTVEKLRDAHLSLTDLVKIFSQRGAVGMQQLINSYEDFNKLLDVTKNSAGTTARMFEQGVGTTRKELDTLKSMYEGLLLTIGNKTSGVVNSTVKLLQNLINNFKSVGGTLMNIASVVVPLLVRKIMVLGRTATTTLGAIKTGVAGLKAAMGGWVTIIATLVTWIGTALYGAWAKVNQPLKDAQKHFEEVEKESNKLKKEASALIDSLGPDTDDATLAGVIKRLTEMFPDFANELNNAYKIAGRIHNWETLKSVLNDIVILQSRIKENEARQQIIDATASKVGNQLYNIGTNPNNKYRQVNNPRNQINYRRESAEWIASAIKTMRNEENNLSQQQVIDKLTELAVIMSQKNKTAGARYGEAYALFEPYGVKMEGDILKHVAYFIEHELSTGFNSIRNQSTQIHQNDSTSVADRVNGLRKQEEDLTKAVEENKMKQEEANELLSEAASAIRGNQHFDKLSDEDQQYVKSLIANHVPPKTNGGGGGGGDKDSELAKALKEYKKSASGLNNQLAKNAITQEQYDEEMKHLNESTWKTITAIENFDIELQKLPGDLQDTAKSIGETFAKNVQDAANKKAEEAQRKINQQIDKLYSEYGGPIEGTRDTSNDYMQDYVAGKGQTFSPAQKNAMRGQLEVTLDYSDALKSLIDKLKEGIANGDFDLVKDEAMAQLKKLEGEFENAKNEATSFQHVLNFAEAQEQLADLQEQLKETTINGVEELARSFGSVTNALTNIFEIFDEDIRDSEFYKGIQAFMTVLESFITIFETARTVIEAFGTAQKIQAKIATQSAAKQVAADMAVASAEGTKAAASAGAAAAGAGSAVASVPIVGPILAVAAIGAVVAAILAAMSKFANGGIVNYGSSSGDHTLARVNQGEMILNKQQQANLFNAISSGNFGGGPLELRVRGADLVACLDNYQSRRRG